MLKVLVVDDSPIGRHVMEAMLIDANMELIFASNGKDAYQKAEIEKPDLIILDIMMPHYDGIEVTEMIRNNTKIKNTPILIATALDDRDTKMRAIKAGANDVIYKPISKKEFLGKLAGLIDIAFD